MKFDVYSRFQLDVVLENGSWKVYRMEPGKRIAINDFVIPSWIAVDELAQYLDDICHEVGAPGQMVRRLQ
jgi:hypothetical protein